MRQEDDKTIVDPENLIASSTNGYEVLENTRPFRGPGRKYLFKQHNPPLQFYITGGNRK